MLPLVNIAQPPVTTQTSLVATAIPENNTLRVPTGNVAPPVSSVAVDPNARGNNQVIAQAKEQPAAQPSIPSSIQVTTAHNLAADSPLGAPATLIAQFMSQRNLPPEVQNILRGVLGEYEQMVANSYIKYRPSNATLPRAEPSSVFNQIVKQNVSAAISTLSPAESSALAASGNQPVNRINATASKASEAASDVIQAEAKGVEAEPAPTVTPAVIRAINAYQNSATRIAANPVRKTVESIEETNAAG